MGTKQEILKHNHIIKGLSNGIGKSRETMALSSFCFDFRLQNLKPIFQFAVQKAESKNPYYYDLYYPDINVFIEVDEDHHQEAGNQRDDIEKENYAKVIKPGCRFYRIRFHESYNGVIHQIEEVKLEILQVIQEVGEERTFWRAEQFDAEEALKGYEKTMIQSISRKKKFSDPREISLQITEDIRKLPWVDIIYVTGETGQAAYSYRVTTEQWRHDGKGQSFHNGTPNYEHPLLLSGSTFYREEQNLIWSPDLDVPFAKRLKSKLKQADRKRKGI